MWNGPIDSNAEEILTAWIAKEELRALLVIAHRLHRFYTWAADADIPEVAALAHTVEVWWPEILAFLQLR